MENWKQSIKCKYCDTEFVITPENIEYKDMKDPDLFVADWQYIINCSNCNMTNILSNLPSTVTTWVQLHDTF
jgi:hypothetical protein